MRFIRFLFILASLFASCCLADSFQPYTYVFRQHVVKVPIGTIDGVRYNDVCLKNEDGCLALKAFRALRSGKSGKGLAGKPGGVDGAGANCTRAGGSELLLTDSRYGTSLFCVFKDLSMVDARALFAARGRRPR